jgi:hypothetical protein
MKKKFDNIDVSVIRQRYGQGESYRKIANSYEVSPSLISSVCNGTGAYSHN